MKNFYVTSRQQQQGFENGGGNAFAQNIAHVKRIKREK